MDLIQMRRKILLNTPHPVTLSSNFVHFKTDMSGLMNISGNGNVTVCGKNLFDELYPNIVAGTIKYQPIFVGDNNVIMSSNADYKSGALVFLLSGNVTSGASTSRHGVWRGQTRTFTAVDGYVTVGYLKRNGGVERPQDFNYMLEIGTVATVYEPYKGVNVSTGTPIKSFLGINNVWLDNCNAISVKYWTH